MITKEVQFLIFCILNLFSMYSLNSLLAIFLKEKNTKYNIIIYIIYFIVGMVTYIPSNPPYFNVFCAISLVMILSLKFEGSMKIKFALSIFWVTFRIMLDLIIAVLYSNLFKINLESLTRTYLNVLVISTFVEITTLIIVKIIKLIFDNGHLSKEIVYTNFIEISIIPIFSLIMLCLYTPMIIYNENYNLNIAISILILVFINIVFFYLLEKLQASEKLKSDINLLEAKSEYYIKMEDNLNESFNKMRIIKHDLKHQLLYLKSKSIDYSLESFEQINNELDILIGEILTENFTEYTENKKLNLLLNSKLSAIESNVDIDVNVHVKEDMCFDEKSLYIILGNIIDNAIINFDSEKSQLKSIKISIIKDDNNLVINVSNPYNKKLLFKDNLPVTDNGDKLLHGLGLKSVRKFVEDKNGFFEINTDNNIFSVSIILFE